MADVISKCLPYIAVILSCAVILSDAAVPSGRSGEPEYDAQESGNRKEDDGMPF